MQAIAIIRSDGGISILRLLTEAPLSAFSAEVAMANGFKEDGETWLRDLTDDHIEMEIARSGLTATSWRRIDENALPSERTFRNAWVDDGKVISHDLDKVRQIVRQAIRSARDFTALDGQAARLQAKAALGMLTPQEKTDLANIEARRQQLRDAPANPEIDAASDIAALKALLP